MVWLTRNCQHLHVAQSFVTMRLNLEVVPKILHPDLVVVQLLSLLVFDDRHGPSLLVCNMVLFLSVKIGCDTVLVFCL